MGWKIGQPAFWQVSWTGGRTYRVWLADCPGDQLAGAIGGYP